MAVTESDLLTTVSSHSIKIASDVYCGCSADVTAAVAS